MSGLSPERLAEIEARWAKTTPGPWFWWGNTDSHNEALCGRRPGLGVCEVISTIGVERTTTDPATNGYREYLAECRVLDPDGTYRDYTEDEIEELVREDWVTNSWGEPIQDRRLAVTDENFIRREIAEQAVYQVARNQGLPDDTPRDNPKVYRADICDVRTPNGKALAGSWQDVRELLAEVKRLQAQIEDLTSIHRRVVRRIAGRSGSWCAADQLVWPCPTVEALAVESW